MPLFSIFKNKKSPKPSRNVFDEQRLSVLLRGHDQNLQSVQSMDTPISRRYAVTPRTEDTDCIEIVDQFPFDDRSSTVTLSEENTDRYSTPDPIDPKIFTVNQNNACVDTLVQHNYTKIRVIKTISQGQLIEARSIRNPFDPIVIKIINKHLHANKISRPDEDGMDVMVAKNIIKEALLLHHCTVANKPPAPYICDYIDFFSDDTNYYLVMEYAGDMNLAQWSQQAFDYISQGKLDLEHYKCMVKHLFWQLSALLYWLHNDMNVCHLAITMEQIMVQNCDFVKNEDGSVSINDKILVKLCDFSLAEIFQSECMGIVGKNAMNSFACIKHCGMSHSQHSAPKLFELSEYNGIKADTWSLGVLLYRLTVGKMPFVLQNANIDCNFRAIEQNKLDSIFRGNGLIKYTTAATTLLIAKLVNCNESTRFDTAQMIQSQYFEPYWQRYGARITKKSLAQRERLNNPLQQKLMEKFPYYSK